jgi:hypothetical protein
MLDESAEKIVADGGIINEVNLDEFKKLAIPIQEAYAKENGFEYLLEMTK